MGDSTLKEYLGRGLYKKRVKCYNWPDCCVTIPVDVENKTDNPRKLCSDCIEMGAPENRKSNGQFGALPTTGEGTSWGRDPFLFRNDDLIIASSVSLREEL